MEHIKYKIFVVFHDTLNLEYYHSSMLQHYIFVNVRPTNTNVYPGLQVINLYEFENFIPIGKWYTESEVIYNIYKNKYLTEGLDFVGFLQYDIDSSILTKDIVTSSLAKHHLLSFEPHLFATDYECNILMDEKRPNQISGTGKNCYDAIFEDYNAYYNTCHVVKNYFQHTINLCSSFVIKINIFEEMLDFAASIIESKKLDKFDTRHLYRIQGGFLERYYGVWLLIQNIAYTEMKLIHNYAETVKQNNSLLNRVKRKLASLIHK